MLHLGWEFQCFHSLKYQIDVEVGENVNKQLIQDVNTPVEAMDAFFNRFGIGGGSNMG